MIDQKLIKENSLLKRRIQELEHLQSEREQLQKALAESEGKYQTLIQEIQTALVIHGPDTSILNCNPMAEEFLGMSKAQMLGKQSIDKDWYFLNSDGSKMDVAQYPANQVIRTRRLLTDYVVGVRNSNKKNKNDVWLLVNAKPIFAGTEIVQIIVTFIDITDRKRATEALQESERKYRNLYHYAHVGLFETNISDARIVACNQRYCDLAGFHSVESAIGMDILHLYANLEDREEVTRILLKQGYIADHVLRLKNRLTGGLFWAEFSARIDTSRNIAEGTIIDITERKQAEEEKRRLLERLVRAEKMESLGILAGGVAHDLNNVLGIVIGYSEMLLIKEGPASPRKSQIEAIMKGAQKAAAIVDDLLTLARRGVSARQVLSLNKIITDCQQSPEFTNLSIHHPKISIKTDLEPSLLNISGSAVHLGKTIYNLISNANEAMPEGGVVTLKTTNQYLDKPVHGYDNISEGDYVVLSISDTGEGVQKADINRIFEPFYTKKVMGRSGTGLGLAVVWGTVKDHNGYINIQSKVGEGSTFTLYFPVTREKLPPEEHIAQTISEYMGQGESILIVDDVKEQREIATIILEELNYRVSSVKSGEEAVVYLQKHQTDLLVLDMIMDPGMDGLDTYRKVLESNPRQKAIVVSGFSESDRVKTVQSLGAGQYVKKPYVMEKLGLAVKEELNRTR